MTAQTEQLPGITRHVGNEIGYSAMATGTTNSEKKIPGMNAACIATTLTSRASTEPHTVPFRHCRIGSSGKPRRTAQNGQPGRKCTSTVLPLSNVESQARMQVSKCRQQRHSSQSLHKCQPKCTRQAESRWSTSACREESAHCRTTTTDRAQAQSPRRHCHTSH